MNFSKRISQNVFLKMYFSKCISQNVFLTRVTSVKSLEGILCISVFLYFCISVIFKMHIAPKSHLSSHFLSVFLYFCISVFLYFCNFQNVYFTKVTSVSRRHPHSSESHQSSRLTRSDSLSD